MRDDLPDEHHIVWSHLAAFEGGETLLLERLATEHPPRSLQAACVIVVADRSGYAPSEVRLGRLGRRIPPDDVLDSVALADTWGDSMRAALEWLDRPTSA